MKWLALSLLTVVLGLQYRLWLSGDGVREVARLSEAVDRQKAENEQLVARNEQMVAEVSDLKAGMAAIEERARSELGMIGRNETFYQVVPARSRTMTIPEKPAEHRPTRNERIGFTLEKLERLLVQRDRAPGGRREVGHAIDGARRALECLVHLRRVQQPRAGQLHLPPQDQRHTLRQVVCIKG